MNAVREFVLTLSFPLDEVLEFPFWTFEELDWAIEFFESRVSMALRRLLRTNRSGYVS